jgi:hypothetical protein
MLMMASVTVNPASRELTDELHTLADVFGERMETSLQVDAREKTARYGPKFAPVTEIPLRRCDVACTGDGVL